MKALLAAMLVASSTAAAADAADPERLAEARALLNAMHIERQIDSVSAVMAQEMTRQFARGTKLGDKRAVQIGMEESMLASKEQTAGPGGLLDTLADAYATQFSLADLRQIRQFYESPAGQRMLLASPELMKQVFPRLMAGTRASTPRVCAKVKARLIAEKVAGGADIKCSAAK